MKNLEPEIFRALLIDAFARATGGGKLSGSLSESDAKTLADDIEEKTGRTVSEKTLRTYARQAFAINGEAAFNPSPYQLETLAQYALYLSDRKKVTSTPSWFQYQRKYRAEAQPVALPVVQEQKPARRRMILWLLLFSLTGAGGLWWALKPVRTQTFSENFNRTLPDSLRARGWQFLDYDSGRFARQLRPDSMLTLWTLPGDYWVKEGEQRKITNMLVHKVDGDCFTLMAKVRDFNFSQRSQQVGIFLLDEKLDTKYWSSINISFADYLSIADSGVLQVLLAYQENGQVMYVKRHSVFLKGETKDGVKTAWLSMLVDHQNVRFSIKKYYEWWPFSEWTPPARINFKPAYIAVGAYQGWTNDDGTPKGADTMPVYIDELAVGPCPKK
jgi:hypothetical protein